jgi:uncharacterized phage protein (TIGR01671 family)
MRDILFRGKSLDNGKWVEGSYTKYNVSFWSGCPVIENRNDDYEVEEYTVGQYTGMVDKNGVKIYEGDIVRTKYGRLCIVVWFASPQHNGWDLTPVDTIENILHTKCPDLYDIYKRDNLEVIGNIHDNPELMK